MPMLRYIKDKAASHIITLRFSILSIFITLFVVTVITLLAIFYYHINHIVQRAGLLLMDNASYSIFQELNFELEPPESASQLSAMIIGDRVLDINNQNEITNYLIDLLKSLPLSQGLHWGDVDGDFIYARKEANGSITTEVINRGAKEPKALYIYRDLNHKEIKRVIAPPDYDPRKLSWFVTALNQKSTIWTDAIVFAHKPSLFGITVATPVFLENGKPWGVFGIDIRLDDLSRYIAQQKIGIHGEILILSKEAKVIASPQLVYAQSLPTDHHPNLTSVYATSKPWVAKAFDIYNRTLKSTFQFKYNEVTYLASFRTIPLLAKHGWLVGMVVPASDFTHSIHRLEFVYIIIFLLIFIAGTIVMSDLVSRIITPIKQLVSETRKVKNFDLEGGSIYLNSHIKEVIELSDAIEGMKTGLRSFQKYVPAGLVRQLIAADEDARIEGTKRDLAVFFSDIKNFTAITEQLDTKELVKQICDYLEAFSRAISQNNGTIDKYIGDSIMAFWGAPLLVQKPCHHAARAILHCVDQLQVMNDHWVKKNKPAFITYFGLHYGETIVGNIGSSERLSYTALGDTVNIASRLVGVNEMYGTSVLVSEVVYKKVKDSFVLRFVDQVMLKGKAESIAIYELLAETKQRVLFDIDTYRGTFDQAFAAYQHRKWHEAIRLFNICLQIYPQDKLAGIFIKRSEHFNYNSPPSDWNGVWRISKK